MLAEFLQEIINRRGETDPVGKKARKITQDLRNGNKVCKLNKALYGLKQAGRQ